MKQVIFSEKAPAPIGPYSQAVQFKDLVFFSGQIALDPLSGQVVAGGVKEQTEQVMKNIKAVLDAGKLGFENIIKTTIFLTDMNDFGIVNEIYSKFFIKDPPARSTVAVAGLPKGVKVEVEITAHR